MNEYLRQLFCMIFIIFNASFIVFRSESDYGVYEELYGEERPDSNKKGLKKRVYSNRYVPLFLCFNKLNVILKLKIG